MWIKSKGIIATFISFKGDDSVFKHHAISVNFYFQLKYSATFFGELDGFSS